ncbi:hypothetical protein Nepgr_033667 [Nepenthes gracilis]|uniref:Uncharacterized protein n=1 Tax=Nepenthes gracilis TaxID=150966 RepID=A0AAD3TMP8_NEPGR|nr:hypothetical protein Nepgr_033667 [Nepenthes gracilis]
MQRLNKYDGVLANTMGVATLGARKTDNPSENIGPSKQLPPMSDRAKDETISEVQSNLAQAGSSFHMDDVALAINRSGCTAPCTLWVMPVSEQLGLPVQNQQSRSGPSCHEVIDDHHGGDQCSCTSLGKLRKNIAELRK